MIYFLLGIMVGLLVALIVLVVSLSYREPVARFVNQTKSALKEKGSILEPEDESVEDWIDSTRTE